MMSRGLNSLAIEEIKTLSQKVKKRGKINDDIILPGVHINRLIDKLSHRQEFISSNLHEISKNSLKRIGLDNDYSASSPQSVAFKRDRRSAAYISVNGSVMSNILRPTVDRYKHSSNLSESKPLDKTPSSFHLTAPSTRKLLATPSSRKLVAPAGSQMSTNRYKSVMTSNLRVD